MRKLKKTIAWFVAVFLIFTSVPIVALADEDFGLSLVGGDAAELSGEPVLEKIPNDETQGIYVQEVVSRREQNVKHFDLGYGKYQAVSYSQPVHRKDADGNWQDINNNLSSENEKMPNLYVTEDLRVAFAKQYVPNQQLFALNENGYLLSMKFLTDTITNDDFVTERNEATEQSVTTVANAPERAKKDTWKSIEEAVTIDNTSSITYSNVVANTDLQYLLSGNNIKENIIVNAPAESYVYRFEMNLEGLIAMKDENGSINLLDATTKELCYRIPAPYMYDANGTLSHDVEYTLTAKSKGVYLLTVTADAEWMNAEDRVYPVVIDPTLSTEAYYDTYINENYPNTNYGLSAELWVATDCITFIQCNELPYIPAGCQFYSASLGVYYYYYSNVTSGTTNVGVYQVSTDWVEYGEYGITWEIARENSGMGISGDRMDIATFRGSVGAYVNSPKLATFDVTDAFEYFYNRPSMNFGVALQYVSGNNTSVIMKSFDSYSGYAPFFTVVYTEGSISSGVYRLKNAASNLYLTVPNSSIDADTPVQLGAEISMSEDSHVSQLFKVTFIRTHGTDQLNYYTIRPMTNSYLGLESRISGSDRNAFVTGISLSEEWENLLYNHLWGISQQGLYYTIQNGYSSDDSYLRVASNSTVGATVFTGDAALTNSARWILEPYTGEAIDYLRYTNYTTVMIPGESFDFNTYMRSSQIGVNGPIVYSISNPDTSATDKATVNSVTGVVNALKEGVVRIRAGYEGAPYGWYYTITIEPSMEGTYFFRNGEYGKYMQIDDNADETEDQAIFELWSFDGDKDQQWCLEYVEKGYYKIKSAAGGLYATAPNALNASIVQTAYTGGTRQQWRFTATSDGRYTVSPRMYPNYRLSAGDGIIIENGRDVELREEREDLKDVWQVDKTYQHAHLSYDARILYDSTVPLTEDQMRQCYENAAAIFLLVFHIQLNLQSISYAPELNLSSECHAEGLNDWCTEECAALYLCNYVHHRGSRRIVDLLPSNEYYTCRIVGYELCAWDEDDLKHNNVGGSGVVNGKDCVVKACFDQNDNLDDVMSEVEYIILHELTHNFGAVHGECDSDFCIMENDDTIGWCNVCKAAIRENYE